MFGMAHRGELDGNTESEFEGLIAKLRRFLLQEHKEDGTHAAITADSLTLSESTDGTATGDLTMDGDLVAGGGGQFGGDVVANKDNTNVLGFPQESALRGSDTGPGTSASLGPSVTIGEENYDSSWAIIANQLFVTGPNGRRQLVFLRRTTNAADLNVMALSTDDLNTAGTYYLYSPVGASSTIHLGTPPGTVSDNNRWGNVYSSGSLFEYSRTVALGIWQSYTPTFTNLTIGNGIVTASYTMIGKTVFAKVFVQWGSTTTGVPASAWLISLPPVGNVNAGGTIIVAGYGFASVGGQSYDVAPIVFSVTQVFPAVRSVVGAYITPANAFTTAIPAAWTTGDSFSLWIQYDIP